MTVLAGAIRWDAWYSQAGAARLAQNELGPQELQYRAPWFAQVVSPYKVNCTGTQAHMDLELQLAAQAGIDYFAFCRYPTLSPWAGSGDNYQPHELDVGFTLYNASAYKPLVKWCAIVSLFNFGALDGWTGPSGDWQQACNWWVTQFEDTQYQKVLGNCPLVYLLSTDTSGYFGGSMTNAATMVTYLRAQCAAVGLGNPYFVIQTFYGSDAAAMTGMPADAVSTYSPAGLAAGLPDTFASLDAQQQSYWVSEVAAGYPIVPNCCDGWDVRARMTQKTTYGARSGQLCYFTGATPAELAAHMQAAISYVNTNPATCPAGTFLTYAWNECAEGRGFMPTLGDPPTQTDTAYIAWQAAHGGPSALPTSNMLEAIGSVLRGA